MSRSVEECYNVFVDSDTLMRSMSSTNNRRVVIISKFKKKKKCLHFSYSATPVEEELERKSADLSAIDTADVDDYDLDDDVEEVVHY